MVGMRMYADMLSSGMWTALRSVGSMLGWRPKRARTVAWGQLGDWFRGRLGTATKPPTWGALGCADSGDLVRWNGGHLNRSDGRSWGASPLVACWYCRTVCEQRRFLWLHDLRCGEWYREKRSGPSHGAMAMRELS